MDAFIKKVDKTISRHGMIIHGSRILVAVSGGPDSAVLLDVLVRLKERFSLELVVAHFDHGLRPADDDRETRFVAGVADTAGLPFVTEKAAFTPDRKGSSPEEAARDQRYAFLDRAKRAHSAQSIALGHTLDDQAETVLMRLLRGSGSLGLSGIPPIREPGIIRPLIDVTRGEIESYIARRELAYVTDPSNLEKRHLRNRIRLELVPQLKTYQPRIVRILGQTADILREETNWMENEANKWIAAHVKTDQTNVLGLPLRELAQQAHALQSRIIRQVIERVQGNLRRIQLSHIEAVKRLLKGQPQATCDLPNGIVVRRSYDTLYFSKRREGLKTDQKENGYSAILNGEGVFKLEPFPCTVTVMEWDKEEIPTLLNSSPWVAHLDSDRISFPLILRNSRPGDRFIPLGMTGHKKLKDFFVDRKIPSHVRKSLPLLCLGSKLVWVCGLRLDDRYKVRPETKKVVRISFSFSEPGAFGLLEREGT